MNRQLVNLRTPASQDFAKGSDAEATASQFKSSGLILVGNPGITHVGRHFYIAAQELGVPVHLCDCEQAYRANPVVSKFNWWFRNHRPTHLSAFSREVSRICIESRANHVVATGLAPLDSDTLRSLGAAGIVRMNFLTDDPWNRQHAATWFMRALPHYDIVFSPRKANMADLRMAGCRDVRYLPFGYAPDIHFIDPPGTSKEESRYEADVFFAGGADAERIPYVAALVGADVKVALYGGYWNRYPEMRPFDHGHANHETLRKAAGGSRIALCLVRRANRDGHAMRTYELAASGACILAEDTLEHREILGDEGECAVYFRSMTEMVSKTKILLADASERTRLAAAVHARIHRGPNTYKDRLVAMLHAAEAGELRSGKSRDGVAGVLANL